MANILQNIYNIQTKLDNLDKLVQSKAIAKPVKIGKPIQPIIKMKIPKLLTQLTNICYYAAGIYLLSMIPELKSVCEKTNDEYLISICNILKKIWNDLEEIEVKNCLYESEINTTFNGLLNDSYNACMTKLKITNYDQDDPGNVFSIFLNIAEPEEPKTIETIKNYRLINKINHDLISTDPEELKKCKDKIESEIHNIKNYLNNETLDSTQNNPIYLIPIFREVYKDMQTALKNHFDGDIIDINGIYSDDKKKCSILYQKKQYSFNKYIIINVVASYGEINIISNMNIQNEIILGENIKYNLICFLQNTGAHWRAFIKIENYWFMYDTSPASRKIIPDQELDNYKRNSTVFLYKQIN